MKYLKWKSYIGQLRYKLFLKKKWANPGLFFCLFSFFSITILQKNCRSQRDSNSDRRSWRWARWPLDHHHGPIKVQTFFFPKLYISGNFDETFRENNGNNYHNFLIKQSTFSVFIWFERFLTFNFLSQTNRHYYQKFSINTSFVRCVIHLTTLPR